MTNKKKATSSELTGGTGFTFEATVSAYYLAALLAEGYATGLENRIVFRVAFQQRGFGEPLDDVIVDAHDNSGSPARLSLQVKRSITVSAAKSNTDFREVIRDSWVTLQKTDFRKGIDRYGAAVGEIAKDKARALRSLCDIARSSITASHFLERFGNGGNASDELKKVKEDIQKLLAEAKGNDCTVDEVHAFLSHFVLLEFDFLHEGASDPPAVMTQLRNCLAESHVGQAPSLWAALQQLARNAAGKSGEIDRPTLVSNLSRTIHLRAAPSLRSDLDRLSILARAWIEDIKNDVGGTHVDRVSLTQALDRALSESRFIQIVGLPGSGKSVVLRQKVDADLTRGPVLFLKSDRLEGKGWSSFANANGLSSVPLSSLLAEIASVGSDTLYIDGIDRIERDHQPIILDILRVILSTKILRNWKVVVSLRDSGLEPLRNWLGEILKNLSISTIKVSSLSDDEANVLAGAKPELRSLLFGVGQVREIVRRPFFAKILSQSFVGEHAGTPFEPRSEIDLIENWWNKGGYDAIGQNIIERQRAAIELASLRARELSQPIALREITSETRNLIYQLIVDGILQHVKAGHSVRFSHDIFFEWSFFHVLLDKDDKWIEEIRSCGEPPAAARIVELLSQWIYKQGNDWTKVLHSLRSAGTRTQWIRAWLLGPLGSNHFDGHDAQFLNVVMENESFFLKKALVWFQAEKTIPNTNILETDIPIDQRVRLADMLGWPSDLALWRRLIYLVISQIDSIPVNIYPSIVSVFEVWQNAFSGIKNLISNEIISQCASWLREIDTQNDKAHRDKQNRWSVIREFTDFKRSLVALLLKASDNSPEWTQEYIDRVILSERLRKETFQDIILYSPILSKTHPQLLVELSLRYLKEELPEDRITRLKIEAEATAKRRRELLAKPKSERTKNDDLFLSHPTFIGGSDFSDHDWRELSIENDHQSFYPPSPLRDPFHSLFKNSPELAIKLLSELSTHAITAWRQLHQQDHDNHGTPIPLTIQFPWGVQEFWGNDKEYQWFRGSVFAPAPIASGFMALEEWCFAELERGQPVDELIQKIVNGNLAIPVLGLVTALAIHTREISETFFPIVTAQRLWSLDNHRMVQDLTSSQTRIMGFASQNDLVHVNAIREADKREVRRLQLTWLATVYIFNGEFGERTREAILGFKNNLPFQYEEERGDQSACDYLSKQAVRYEELADKDNYRAEKSEEHEGYIEISHFSPSATTPENIEKGERARLSLAEGNQLALASRALESGKLDDNFDISAAIDFAKRIDSDSLYKEATNDIEVLNRRGTVAATAALALHFRDNRSAEDLEWARSILIRAVEAPELRDEMWSERAIIPWHQGIFVASGFADDILYGTAHEDAGPILLVLVANPLEIVSLSALEKISVLWDKNPELVWAAFLLALSLCHIEPRQRFGFREPLHSEECLRKTLSDIFEYYQHGHGWAKLPIPPPAWVRAADIQKNNDNDGIYAPDREWVEHPTHWYAEYAGKIINHIPFEKILISEARDELLSFVSGVFKWTIERNSPPWAEKGKRDRESSNLYEWTHQLGSTLGRVSGFLPLQDVKSCYLDVIFDLEGDTCWSLLNPFTSSYICRYVCDAKIVPADAVNILDLCLTRFLQTSSLQRGSYRAGEFHGFDEPLLAKILMFVSVESASLSSRFVNGDWTDIQLILPLIDRFIRAAGWSASVMICYLTFCERSRTAYPAVMFADQILSVIEDGSEPLQRWHGTIIPPRIAALVQYFADRDTPMNAELSRKLLRILDFLVDMGDRRSAALQQSERFREIKVV